MLRIGILGAARIAPQAVIVPAHALAPQVRVEAVAARDPKRALDFARRFAIPRAVESYELLLADPEIDAIYNPLPNSLHAPWTIRALEAGKHVLCEKPMASNAREAEQMRDAAARTGRVLMEAFHYRYHPLTQRLKEIVASGELGDLQHVEAHFCVPLFNWRDIRYRYELGGGATMDLGCYCLNLIRFLTAAEPEVTGARARLASPQVDRFMEAEFRIPGAGTARMSCSFWSLAFLRTWARASGTKGQVRVLLPFQPHFLPRLEVRTADGSRVERFSTERTYAFQLRRFGEAIAGHTPVMTSAADAVAGMSLIDAVYRKAGLKERGLAAEI